MAAAAASTSIVDAHQLPWPRWVASLGADRSVEVTGLSAIPLTRPGAPRSLTLFCEPGQPRPVVATSSERAVIFEGILYNADELGKQLGFLAAEIDNASIVLGAYQRWGEEVLQKLRGLFALAIWDGGRNTLLCARDSMGNHPLFYAKNGGELLISTSLEDLLRHPSVPQALNRAAIVSYVIDYWPRTKETFYESVNRIPPGSAMRAGPTDEAIYRYWDPDPPSRDKQWAQPEEIERFGEVLARAIDRFLDLGRTAIFLSGGFDSTSIAALANESCAAREMPPLLALSLVFPHPEANEESVQKGVAERLGIAQELMAFDTACGTEGFLRASLNLSESLSLPLQNMWLPCYNSLGALGKRLGYGVVLAGNGGDEWLGVSPYLSADLIRSFDVSGLYAFWLETLRSFGEPALAMTSLLLWRFGLRALLRDGAVRTLRSSSPSVFAAIARYKMRGIAPPWLKVEPKLWKEICYRAETSETERANESDHFGFYRAETRRALSHPLISWEMEELFENGRKAGIRVLYPYLDAELAELLYRIPPAILNQGGRSKGLVRQWMSKRFPGLGFERQKKVRIKKFLAELMRREGPSVWKELGGAKALANLGLADAGLIDPMISRLLDSFDHRDAFRAWSIMALESWLRARI